MRNWSRLFGTGDDEALEFLINKYRNFVRAKARSYFLIGADREDIVQEGMMACSSRFAIFARTS